jgi:hypothetical protein
VSWPNPLADAPGVFLVGVGFAGAGLVGAGRVGFTGRVGDGRVGVWFLLVLLGNKLQPVIRNAKIRPETPAKTFLFVNILYLSSFANILRENVFLKPFFSWSFSGKPE